MISFYLECLTSKFNVSNLRVIDSAVVSFLVNQLDEEEEDFQSECSSMDIFESGNSNFLIPVNSSYASSETFGEVGAGNHWSLLHIVILEAQGKKTSSTFGRGLRRSHAAAPLAAT